MGLLSRDPRKMDFAASRTLLASLMDSKSSEQFGRSRVEVSVFPPIPQQNQAAPAFGSCRKINTIGTLFNLFSAPK